MRVVVDTGTCIGSGSCAQVAPTVFRLGDDGALEVLDREPPDDRRDAVEAAAALCPTAAIALR